MYKFLFTTLLLLIFGCQKQALSPVSVAEFSEFVEATNYVTDAEKFDWSIVQEDVFKFNVLFGVNWRCPDGEMEAKPDFPVTQISYNDALAYCRWADVRLPSYEEYWQMTQSDNRPIVQSAPQILPINQVNIIGNVWEITTSERRDGQIRLAGGSYLCNKNTCNGTSQDRVLYVDKMTGNTHIGFSVTK